MENSAETKNKPSNAKIGCIGCLGLIVLVAIIAGICAVIPGGDDSDSDADPIETRWEGCFDPWDGNHREFEQLVKDQLNAPATFEHVETRFSVEEFPRSVVMTYEAENLFGVPLRRTATALSDIDCNVTVITYE